MEFNYLVSPVAAVVPVITGYIWYGLIFNNAWMNEMNFTEDSMKGENRKLIFGMSYVLGLIICTGLISVVIHQMGIYSTLLNEPGFNEHKGEAYNVFTSFMENYGTKFRTFKHGALHGALLGVLVVMPILSVQAIFERKSSKYIAINVGYWIVTLAIMGGIICQWI